MVLALVILGVGAFILASLRDAPPEPVPEEPIISGPVHEVIGISVEGREIGAYTYGDGETHLAFVGGVHGGYEWNSVFLAYRFMDYLDDNLEAIPDALTLTVIPSLNPDGVFTVAEKEGRFAMGDISTNESVLASGRFNANEVDLNRNFDCKWEPKSTWRSREVSGGSGPFSEPETAAFRDFVVENDLDAAIFWHSQSNAVYASACEEGILPETLDIMDAYSQASGYPAIESFDSYSVTGAADDWLASVGIPAITVELSTHEDVEWEQNLAGVEALFEYYTR